MRDRVRGAIRHQPDVVEPGHFRRLCQTRRRTPRFTSGPAGTIDVLYVVGYYRAFTGSQRSLCLLVEHLPTEIGTAVLFTGEGRATAAFRDRGLNTMVLPVPPALDAYGGQLLRSTRQRVGCIGDALRYSARVWRILGRLRPAIVHCNDTRALLLVGLAARARRIPVVWHLRGYSPIAHIPVLNVVAQRLASTVVVVAHAVAPERLRPGLPCLTIYNGIPPRDADEQTGRSWADEVISRAGFPPDRAKRLMVASSLTPYKGHHHLFRALSMLLDGSYGIGADELVCLVLGNETAEREKRYAAYLRGYAEELGITRNVLWLGWQDDAVSWMRGCDVVVLPTVDAETLVYPDGTEERLRCLEGFPRTLLEAMATGRASVSSDVAGVREAVEDEVTGLVVPPRDAVALADALARLVRDDALRGEMGRRARARAESFTIRRTAADTAALYRRMVQVPGD